MGSTKAEIKGRKRCWLTWVHLRCLPPLYLMATFDKTRNYILGEHWSRSLITCHLLTSNPGFRLHSSSLGNQTQTDPVRTRRRKKIPVARKRCQNIIFICHIPGLQGGEDCFSSFCLRALNCFGHRRNIPPRLRITWVVTWDDSEDLRILLVYLVCPFNCREVKTWVAIGKTLCPSHRIQASHICDCKCCYLTVTLTSLNSLGHII